MTIPSPSKDDNEAELASHPKAISAASRAPVEILEQIIAYSIPLATYDNLYLRSKNLLSVSLITPSWLCASFRTRYRDIVLKSPTQARSFVKRISEMDEEERSKTSKLITTLRIGGRTWGSDDGEREGDLFDAELMARAKSGSRIGLDKVLRCCPALQVLFLDNVTLNITDLLLCPDLKALRLFKVGMSTVTPPDQPLSSFRFNNLEHLELREVHMFRQHASTFLNPSILPKLSILHLGYNFNDIDLLSAQSILPQIHHLVLERDSIATIEDTLIVEQLHSLQTLIVDFPYALAALSFHSLNPVHLRIHAPAAGDFNVPFVLPFLRHNGPPLRLTSVTMPLLRADKRALFYARFTKALKAYSNTFDRENVKFVWNEWREQVGDQVLCDGPFECGDELWRSVVDDVTELYSTTF